MLKFKTLLLREWMQHHRGWFILSLVPLLIAVLTIPFGSVQLDGPENAQMVAILGVGAYTIGVLLLGWLSVMIQTPGLARRDQQDRSIEFWVSLPTAHWQNVLATVLTHLLLMPLLVLCLAFVGGQLVAPLLVVKVFGWAGLGELPMGLWLMDSGLGFLRLLLGVVVSALWLSPMLLAAMAAAAWLKRWGVPLLAAVVGIGGGVLAKVYGNPIVYDIVDGLFMRALAALIPGSQGEQGLQQAHDRANLLHNFPAWVMHDTALVLQDLASPWLLGAAVVSAGCFGLLVLRRQRGV
ncbi:MAG TPA: hypothetical protein VLA16_08970 [Ideonella sp.]|nr:hypothetical protein [Ideonella sp.]